MTASLRRAVFYGLFFGQLLMIGLAWYSLARPVVARGGNAALVSYGGLWGLAAGFFFLWQLILISGFGLFERYFGLDRLARIHHVNGFVGYFFLVAHVLFIVSGYAGLSQSGFVRQLLDLTKNYPYVLWAGIALVLFDLVIISSIVIVRRRLKYEWWYAVHLLVYAAVLSALLHQIRNGQSLIGSDWLRYYWLGLYVTAFSLVLWKRWFLPLWLQIKHGFMVERIVQEADGVTSIYVSGRNISSFSYNPGQFALWQFMDRRVLGMHHPFSFSSAPGEPYLRISAKAIGDFTRQLPGITPGSRVLLSGPYGRFISNGDTNRKRLFIAGGIGITPIRSILAYKVQPEDVLLYAARTKADLAFFDELESWKSHGLNVMYVLSEEDQEHMQRGYLSKDMLSRITELKERDVWLCGPPPMMTATENMLKELGVPQQQIYTERFRL